MVPLSWQFNLPPDFATIYAKELRGSTRGDYLLTYSVPRYLRGNRADVIQWRQGGPWLQPKWVSVIKANGKLQKQEQKGGIWRILTL